MYYNYNKMALQRSYVKNCPTLPHTLSEQMVNECNFNFTEEFYIKFKNFMIKNPGKTTIELCQLIKFYKFTPKTLSTAFKLFNTYTNTYYQICGPFIYKDNRWFPIYSKKYTDTVILAQENSYLRDKIQNMKLQIELLNKSQ